MFVLRLMLVFTFYLRVGQGEICFPLPEFSSACRKNGKQKNSGKLVVSRPPPTRFFILKHSSATWRGVGDSSLLAPASIWIFPHINGERKKSWKISNSSTSRRWQTRKKSINESAPLVFFFSYSTIFYPWKIFPREENSLDMFSPVPFLHSRRFASSDGRARREEEGRTTDKSSFLFFSVFIRARKAEKMFFYSLQDFLIKYSD